MAHDHDVDAHRLDVLGRVDERLALGGAGAAGGEVERVGPEPPGGEAEADAGAGGGLEEEIDDDLALEVVALGRVADPDAEEPLGGVEQSREFRGREPFETE